MKNKIIAETFFDMSTLDIDSKTIPVILSEETKVLRYNFKEGVYDLILDHKPESVDLKRKDILPILLQHDTNMLPLGIYENVRLEDGKLKATAKFDTDDEMAMKVFGKIQRGFMQSLSVGINVHKAILEEENNENGRKTYRATNWEITEASIVTIPAIPGARVGLSIDDIQALATMPSDNEKIVNSNLGANMEFNQENFNELLNANKVLSANRETMSNRYETLSAKLETVQAALDTTKEENAKLKASSTSTLSDAETAVREALSMNITNVDTVIKMMNATPEEATKLALLAKEDSSINQGDSFEAPKDAWAEFIK